jgi:hypothetical protein
VPISAIWDERGTELEEKIAGIGRCSGACHRERSSSICRATRV